MKFSGNLTLNADVIRYEEEFNVNSKAECCSFCFVISYGHVLFYYLT